MLCLLQTQKVFLSYKYDNEFRNKYNNEFRNTRSVNQFRENVDSKVTKPKRGHKKKTDPKINEVEESDIREKRERLVAYVLSGNSKQYLGKEYTKQQINEIDCTNVNTLINRYESVLSAQMTKSLGKSVINLYSNIACSVIGVGNQQDLSNDWSVILFLTQLCKDLHAIFTIALVLC